MVVGRITSRISRTVVACCRSSLIPRGRPDNHHFIPILANHFHSLHVSQDKVVANQISLFHNSVLNSSAFQRLGFSSSASPQPNEKEASQTGQETSEDPNGAKAKADTENTGQAEGSDENVEQDSLEEDLSKEDLVKLVSEKEELLKTKYEEIEKLKDNALRKLAEMQNIMERTRRESENSRKFAIQSFVKNLLDVADNLGRASSVVKESFAQIDTSQDSAGAVPLLKTLLEGVEMTEKQLSEVFKKFGVQKFDPINEEFNPSMHEALMQVTDPTKPPNTVAVVLKAGYMLHDRVIRPAEVGVTVPGDE